MSFEPELVNDFIHIFNQSQNDIKMFPGCIALSLFKEKGKENIMYTWSIWESEDALEKYRASELFTNTWSKTKKLFNAPPIAYSLEQVMEANALNL
jgi:quinol monooxygenase YgiN